ncbi:MAG: DMP19 family protein [Bacteroidia bacterium]|nr:DMP19 family protein [Bacteroidia bacterium]
MKIFSSILNLFRRQKYTNVDFKKIEAESLVNIEKLFEDFNNRTIHKILTEKIINETSDTELLQVVFDNLMEKVKLTYEIEYSTVLTWNKSRQAIYMIWLLESEVNNGGFNQFYYNSTGQFSKHIPDALNLVGANNFSNLTSKANEIYEKEHQTITKNLDDTWDGFSKSYKNNPLNNLDTKFYELYKTENLQQIQIDYIRKHIKDFIDQ